MAINKNDSLAPLHYQLSKTLQEEIHSGNFKQGDLFATEKSLMERFGVSSTTIRRVLQDLVQKGYLYRQVGKGTFVRRAHIEESLGPLSTFFEEMEKRGLRPTSDILTVRMQKADQQLANKLQVAESDSIYFIKKLLIANKEPIGILNSYWPVHIGRELIKYDISAIGLFYIVENVLGIKLREAEATIEAALATEEESLLLEIPKGNPILLMKRVVYSADGKTVNCGEFAYNGGKYKYHARMVRYPTKYIPKDMNLNCSRSYFEPNSVAIS